MEWWKNRCSLLKRRAYLRYRKNSFFHLNEAYIIIYLVKTNWLEFTPSKTNWWRSRDNRTTQCFKSVFWNQCLFKWNESGECPVEFKWHVIWKEAYLIRHTCGLKKRNCLKAWFMDVIQLSVVISAVCRFCDTKNLLLKYQNINVLLMTFFRTFFSGSFRTCLFACACSPFFRVNQKSLLQFATCEWKLLCQNGEVKRKKS